MNYQKKIKEQIEQFKNVDIHALPDIFHYWSNKYIRPKLETVFNEFRFDEIYADFFKAAMQATGDGEIVSLGAGDGDVEMAVAEALRRKGAPSFRIICLEISDHLITRGNAQVASKGLQDFVEFRQADLNAWRPAKTFAGFMANHSLHHFVELERIFDLVAGALAPQGLFVTHDMIGRNGHQRWPEALALVQFFWDHLPERYKFNHQLKRWESPKYLDWDCSGEGFEGIRAQDILPLLLERFQFSHFAAWGGLTEVFVDRGFGHNFDQSKAEDRAFVDQIEAVNQTMQDLGLVKPTQMIAVMGREVSADCRVFGGLTPRKALRDPQSGRAWVGGPQ